MPLAEFFRDMANRELECSVSGFSSEARKALLTHAWPGNVREPDRAIPPLLYGTEQHLLGFQREVSYLVQKQRAAFRLSGRTTPYAYIRP